MSRRTLVAKVAAGVALSVLVGCDDDGPVGQPPTFTESADLPGVGSCSLAWGDCDNDGDLDLAVAGNGGAYITKVYGNDGAGGFTDLTGASLAGAYECSLAWGDADNDGDLDLAVAGLAVIMTKAYENLGGAVPFDGTELAASLPALQMYPSLAWGDCDNDGDLDLAIAGLSGTIITTVCENVGGAFDGTELATGLTGVYFCSLAWGDADNDGDLDLAVAGRANSGRIATVYENVGGAFDGTKLADLQGVESCSLAWGDCDNDGDLDLAVAGYTGSGYITKVYENDGAGGFTDLTGTSLTGVYYCSLAWGDADNDGDLDLAVAGDTGSAYVTKVYENVGGVFDGTELATGLTGVAGCSLAWGDCDNDGDLDLAVAGWTGSGQITKVYENHGPLPNSPPGAPTGLGHCGRLGEREVLVWSPAGDAETPPQALSYNLMIREASGMAHVNTAMADEATGARLLPARGPVVAGEQYSLFGIRLEPGDYEARVQAVDSAFEGGPWSEPCVFTVP